MPAVTQGTLELSKQSEHVFWKTVYKAAGVLALRNFRVGKDRGCLNSSLSGTLTSDPSRASSSSL